MPRNIPPFTLLSPTSPPQRGGICGVEGLDRVAVDADEGDVCDCTDVSHLRLPRQPASASGATTPGFSGPFPSQCVDAAHTVTRVTVCSWQLGSFLFGMPARGPSGPLLVGFRVPPLTRSAIVRWQEATDPQSPKGGSQRACPTTASGRLLNVALLKQTYPAWQLRPLSLRVASPGSESSPSRLVGFRVAALLS